MNKLRVLDLFSGIGGFSLGLERTGGFETVAFCEIEAFPRKVLAKHWPNVPCYRDVRTLTAERLAADGIAVDVICGGFPCQDISTAGKGLGLAGERSGLWSEIARLVGELAPRFVIVENVAALLGRGLGDVLGDLASLGYDAEWHCIPASAVGAPHRRDRIWIVAHPPRIGHRQGGEKQHLYKAHGGQDGTLRAIPVGTGIEPEDLANTPSQFRNGGEDYTRKCLGREQASELGDGGWQGALANAISQRQPGPGTSWDACDPAPLIQREAVDALNGRVGDFWRTEPNVGRVANGVPDRTHRLKALGNAVVPQIPELIGNAILQAIASERIAA